jgi:C4-dicarboxylate-binding protein DctP
MPILAALVIAIAIAFSLPDAQAAGPIVIKYNHVVPAGTPKGQAADIFAKLANERLAGKVKVEVFPSAQLFEEDSAFQALLLGDVQITAPVTSKVARYTKKLQVWDLPFLFDSREAANRFEQSPVGKKLLDSMLDKGFKGLAYGREGMRSILSKKLLRRPGDMAGVKIRIMESDVLEAQYRAINAVPQKMAFSELYNALETGVVDACESNWASFYGAKFYEAAKYFIGMNVAASEYVLLTNAKFWNGLPADIRTQLEAILAEAMKEEYRLDAEQEVTDKEKIMKMGLNEFVTVTPQEVAAWREAMKPVWKQFEAEIGKDIIDAALASNIPR